MHSRSQPIAGSWIDIRRKKRKRFFFLILKCRAWTLNPPILIKRIPMCCFGWFVDGKKMERRDNMVWWLTFASTIQLVETLPWEEDATLMWWEITRLMEIALTVGCKRIKSPCNCSGVMLNKETMVLESELTETGAGIAQN